MSYKDLKLIQEKASGLFFTPVDGAGRFLPVAERYDGWLFDEKEALALIRTYFGGDHGVELVRLLPCEQKEFYRWCGRKGGMTKSPKKRRSSALNGKQPKTKTSP